MEHMGGGKNKYAYRIFVGKSEGNRAFVGDIWVYGDNIKVERVGWFSYVQHREKSRAVVNAELNFLFIKCGEFFDWLKELTVRSD